MELVRIDKDYRRKVRGENKFHLEQDICGCVAMNDFPFLMKMQNMYHTTILV